MFDLMSTAQGSCKAANPLNNSNHKQNVYVTNMSTSQNYINNNGHNALHQSTASINIQNLAKTNPKASKLLSDYKQIILELRAQNFDVIRFATYRTASKLRFIQKKLNLHLIDLWNVIETFRDNNIHTLDLQHEIEIHKVEACIQNMYIELNKRLAFNQHINVETQTQLLTAWLLNLYDKNRLNRMKVISFKIALTTMCAGKLTDKIKYIFNQISDTTKNCLIFQKFELYLKELLVLPTSVFEEPSFGYNENLSKTCFDLSNPIMLNDFLNVALSDLGPACFIWLNIFHRFTVVQNVQHPVTCSVCQRTHFNGFRYKCQKCRKYQLCQDCFWRGRVSNSHQLTHQMKEYTNYKSAAKQFSNTLKKSFFCKPANKTRQQQQLQGQVYQKERQSQLLQQKPVEIHQLTYQKQYDYENALSNSKNNQQNCINENENINDILAARTTSHENASDYNLLYRNEPTKCGNLSNGNSNMNLGMNNGNYNYNDMNTNYSAASTLNRTGQSKTKSSQNLLNSSNLGIDDGNFFVNDCSNMVIQKPIDMNHIIPPQSNHHQINKSITSTNNNNYVQSSSLKKSKKAHHINAHNLTTAKAKQLENLNISPNILAKFLLANNQNLSQNSENLTQDEHSVIANYSSLLAEFYTKNPHLASSPTSCASSSNSPSLPVQNTNHKLKPSIKPKPIFENNQYRTNNMSSNDSPLQRQTHRTASLQRSTNCPSSHRLTPKSNLNSYNNNTYQNSMNFSNTLQRNNNQNQNNNSGHIIPMNTNTTRSVSESNFRTNNDLEDFNETCQEEILLKEKRQIVAKLEKQNKEIMGEIHRLKLQQVSNKSLDKTDLNQLTAKDAWLLQEKLQLKHKSRESTPVNVSTLARTKNNQLEQLLNANPQLKLVLAKMNSSINNKDTTINPNLVVELHNLKTRKGLLENRMNALENSRDHLIGRLTQLDTSYMTPVLSKKSKVMGNNSHSLRTTPVNSPRPGNRFIHNGDDSQNSNYMSSLNSTTFIPIVSASMAMPMNNSRIERSGIITCVNRQAAAGAPSPSSLLNQDRNGLDYLSQNQEKQPRSWSTPTTPALNEFHTNRNIQPPKNNQIPYSASYSLVSLNAAGSGSNTSLYSQNSSNCNSLTKASNSNLKNLRNDLLIAADSVTNAMQGLVRELNSENENIDSDNEDITENQELLNEEMINNENKSLHFNRPSSCSNQRRDEVWNSPQQNDASAVTGSNPVSSVTTPVLFRRNNSINQQHETTTRLLQNKLMKKSVEIQQNHHINLTGYRNGINLDNFNMNIINQEESNEDMLLCSNASDYEGDADDDEDANCLLTESFIDDYGLTKFQSSHGLDTESIQEQFDLQLQEQKLQEQEMELENNLLAENLCNNTNEQVAEWRRELEQRLIDDKTQNNDIIEDVNNNLSDFPSNKTDFEKININRDSDIDDINKEDLILQNS